MLTNNCTVNMKFCVKYSESMDVVIIPGYHRPKDDSKTITNFTVTMMADGYMLKMQNKVIMKDNKR